MEQKQKEVETQPTTTEQRDKTRNFTPTNLFKESSNHRRDTTTQKERIQQSSTSSKLVGALIVRNIGAILKYRCESQKTPPSRKQNISKNKKIQTTRIEKQDRQIQNKTKLYQIYTWLDGKKVAKPKPPLHLPKKVSLNVL